MKVMKYLLGFGALVLFFLLIDQTGIGFKNHITAIKDWASGDTDKLHFEKAWKDQ